MDPGLVSAPIIPPDTYAAMRGCYGKRRYASERKAQGALWVLRKNNAQRNESIHVYGCALCGGWHIGHEY